MMSNLITYKQAQKIYGVGRSKLQRLVVNGVIAAYRPGKEILLDRKSIEEWFLTTKVQPVPRIGRPRRGARRR